MTLRGWLMAAAEKRSGTPRAGPRCGADWRRPDGYWHCTRPDGHRGRHRMTRTAAEEAGRDEASEQRRQRGEGDALAR